MVGGRCCRAESSVVLLEPFGDSEGRVAFVAAFTKLWGAPRCSSSLEIAGLFPRDSETTPFQKLHADALCLIYQQHAQTRQHNKLRDTVNRTLSIILTILATLHSGSSTISCNVSMAQVVAPGSHLNPSSYAPHGKKRAAESELKNEQRLSKRFDLLNLGMEAPFTLYFTSPSPSHTDTQQRTMAHASTSPSQGRVTRRSPALHPPMQAPIP